MELSAFLNRSSRALRKAYSTDLNNGPWEILQSILSPAVPKPGCDPTDLREIVNALPYQNKTGCQWDMLPHDLPPKSTAFDDYTRWRADGTWDRLLDSLRRRVRAEAGRESGPTAAVADSQSAPTAQAGGEQRGFDGGKKVKGRKPHIPTDTMGLLLSVVVMGRLPLPTRASLRKVYADGRYHDTVFRAYLEGYPHIDLGVVSRPKGTRGLVIVKKRGVVERTFAWGRTYRRLSRDYEKLVAGGETRVKMASIHTMLKRRTRNSGREPGITDADNPMGRKVS